MFKKKDEANMNIGEITISGCSNKKMQEIQAILSSNSIKWKPAAEPIFDFDDHVLQTYVALTLGCDAFIKGIPGLGPTKVTKILQAVCQRCEK